MQRKQCRGGASKNRIERLREETVHNYLKLASEKAYTYFVKDGIPIIQSLLILGPGMKKIDIQEYLKIDVPIYINSIENECDIKEYVMNMILEESSKDEEKHINHLQNLMRTNPDILSFGKDIDLTDSNIKCIYADKNISGKQVIILSSGFLKQFDHMICELYTSIDITDFDM